MSDYVFSEYMRLLMDAWRGRCYQYKLINTLYDAIQNFVPDICNQLSDRIEVKSKVASEIAHNKKSVHNEIISHKDDKAVIENIDDYFEENIIHRLEESKIEELASRLTALVSDSDRPPETKKKLLELYSSEGLTKFLTATYLESLARDNKLERTGDIEDKPEIPPFDARGYQDVEVPENITSEESKYVRALADAYLDDANEEARPDGSLVEILNDERYHGHFVRQRQDYFNADFVRHSTRGASYGAESDPFSDLEREIYDTIIDVHEREFTSGYLRLSHCLERAAAAEVLRSWMNADQRWLSNSVKKGVCHFLVNDEMIEGWVRHE